MRPCAICGWRDAVDETKWEDRMVPACGVCLEPPDEPPEPYEPTGEVLKGSTGSRERAIIDVLRRFGEATLKEITLECGVADVKSNDYDAYNSQVYRMVKRGVLSAEGKKNAGRRYRIARAA